MARILLIGSTFDLPELHIFGGLARRGYAIDAVVSEQSKLRSALEDYGITCHTLDFRSRIDFRAIGAVRKLLRQNNYDIVHCLTARGLSNTLLASVGIAARIVAYRGTSGRDSRWSPASWLSFLHPRVRKIICVSNAVQRFLADLVPSDKLVTIYKGHDIRWYDSSTPVDLKVYQIPDDAFVVSCVANMRPVKGIPYLLRALRHIPPEVPVHLLLIGEVRAGAGMEELQDPELARRVHTTGFQPNVAPFLARSHAFVLPSVSREGLPKAMMEALSVGVPVIVTNVGGMPEIVSHERTGLVVPAADAAAIAEAVLRLRNDPAFAQALGKAGKRSIIEQFSVDRSITETNAVYQELLAEAPS